MELSEIQAARTGSSIKRDEVAKALGDFDNVWEALVPRERARVLELLVERIYYDGEHGNMSITFRPTGIKALAAERSESEESAA